MKTFVLSDEDYTDYYVKASGYAEAYSLRETDRIELLSCVEDRVSYYVGDNAYEFFRQLDEKMSKEEE